MMKNTLNNKQLCFLLSVGFVIMFVAFPLFGNAQSSNHWSRNFNEESSLVSGAVVGGGAGAAAIYYNPASISEIKQSKLSVNASLFSLDALKAKNAWGDDIDFLKNRFVVVPRFISFMLKPQNSPNWSLEIAFINNENYEAEDVGSIDKQIDILKQNPGEERYNAFYRYDNKYRDDWIGIGGSYKISPELSLGASMFASIRSLSYSYMVDIEAGPIVGEETDDRSYYTAKHKDQEFLKFNNYRLLWKLGVMYKKDDWSFGLNISTPSLGVYSDSKRVARKISQSNITDPETGYPISDFLVSDYADTKDVKVGYKNPLSIALGATWTSYNKTKIVYTTVEYFAKLDPYRMVDAQESYDVGSTDPKIIDLYDEWLTYAWGAKPICNAAFGYQWTKNEETTLMGGFRTDFNYRKDFNYNPLLESRTIKGFHLNKYHFTGGITTKFRGQDLMAGIQYTFGRDKNQKQFANLSDPVEYNSEYGNALQGIKQNTMDAVLHSVSLYFGATFNFKKKDNSNL